MIISMRVDIVKKRGVFIGKMNSLSQEFHFAPPDIIIRLMNIHTTTLYGSNTWDILSKDCEKLYSSFNVAIRQILQVDRCTHRYLIETLSECLHLKTVIASRFVTFHKTLLSSNKKPVRFLARLNEQDLRTVMGRTLNRLTATTGLCEGDPSKLTSVHVKRHMKYCLVPENERWRVSLCQELLNARGDNSSVPGFTVEELEEMLRVACTS